MDIRRFFGTLWEKAGPVSEAQEVPAQPGTEPDPEQDPAANPPADGAPSQTAAAQPAAQPTAQPAAQPAAAPQPTAQPAQASAAPPAAPPTPPPAASAPRGTGGVRKITVSAVEPTDIAPGLRLNPGETAVIQPGDLSGNVSVEVGGTARLVPDADVKAGIQQGRIRVDAKESLSQRAFRLLVEAADGPQCLVRDRRPRLPGNKPRVELGPRRKDRLNRVLGEMTKRPLKGVPVNRIREALRREGLDLYGPNLGLSESRTRRSGHRIFDVGARDTQLLVTWHRERPGAGAEVVAYLL